MQHTPPVLLPPYDNLDDFYKSCNGQSGLVLDHIMGFDSTKRNFVLDYLDKRAEEDNIKLTISTNYAPEPFSSNYKNLFFKVSFNWKLINQFKGYKNHPPVNFKNFICSFNGAPHVSRQLLVALLKKYKWYNPEYSSQCFEIYPDKIDGYVQSLIPDKERIYRKIFVPDSVLEGNTLYDLVQLDHASNIKILEKELTQSFLHLVSESIATSYCPSHSEKFLYSIVTRGLFLSFAGPGWHALTEDTYGFKLYTKLFDYTFDKIENPIERLVELTSMISKFSHMSIADLHDLYLMELDSINYNYDRYFSDDWKTSMDARHGAWLELHNIT